VRPFRTKHSPVVHCNCCCLFQAPYDAVCIQFVLSECPDTWNTTISVMSNVNARHYMNISPRRDETEQTPSLLTVQTLSQVSALRNARTRVSFPHSVNSKNLNASASSDSSGQSASTALGPVGSACTNKPAPKTRAPPPFPLTRSNFHPQKCDLEQLLVCV
jgi:hypothetical protein